ncbi:hypothetical protein MBLNU230_g4384t1 [Neophaeotheca triangularis]
MRLDRTSSSDQQVTVTVDDERHRGSQLPRKAERLLGTRALYQNSSAVKSRAEDQRPHGACLDAEERRGYAERGNSHDDSSAISRDSMPTHWKTWRHRDKQQVSSGHGAVASHHDYSKNSNASLQSQMRREPSNSTMGSQYYDPARLPSTVSQQTSASAIRDRRWIPPEHLHASASDPALVSSDRPLKSAMKRPTQDRRVSDKGLRRPRKFDISSFFSRSKPSQDQRSSAAGSSSIPPTYGPAEPLEGLSGRENLHLKAHETPASRRATRAKIFDNDLDTVERTRRRPPKGISNWFDGLDDISSEDECEDDGVAVAATTSYPVPRVPAQEDRSRAPQPVKPRGAMPDPVQDNLLAIRDAKIRLKRAMQPPQRRGSEDSNAVDSAVSAEERKRLESRLAGARLAKESILSLSSSSEDERPNLPAIRDSLASDSIHRIQTPSIRNARSVGVLRPAAPARQLQSSRSFQRESAYPRDTVSTFQTSGSIPIRLNSDIPIPPLPMADASNGSDSAVVALHQLEGKRESQRASSRLWSTSENASAQDDGESFVSETTTSYGSEPAHMFAVTEEEMALLEMMRKKRAAMAQNSFSEGHRTLMPEDKRYPTSRRGSSHHRQSTMLGQESDNLGARQNHSPSGSSSPSFPQVSCELEDIAFREGDCEKDTQELEGSREAVNHASGQLLLPQAYDPRAKQVTTTLHPVGKTGGSPQHEFGSAGGFFTDDHDVPLGSTRTPTTDAFPAPPTGRKPSSQRRSRKSPMSPQLIVEEEPIPEQAEVHYHYSRAPGKATMARATTGEDISTDKSVSTCSSPATGSHPTGHHWSPYHASSDSELTKLDSAQPGSKFSFSSAGTSSVWPRTSSSSAHSPSDEARSTINHQQGPVRERRSLVSSQRQAGKPRMSIYKGEDWQVPQGVHRVGSVRSQNSHISAGEDVLAAWAALGGGSEAFTPGRGAR